MEEKQELPQGWVWTTVGQIGKAVTGNTPSTSKPEFYGGNIPFFKPSDLGHGYSLTEAETNLTEAGARSARVLPAESILVTCIGATIGKTGFAKVAGTTNQQINALVPDTSIVFPQFGYFAFISPILFRQVIGNASSTTLPILNKSKFEALKFPLPPLPEQRRIVAKLEELISRLDAGVAAVRRTQALLKRYRQSVLHAAVTGELTRAWREAHPAPAETGAALLARIRAERRAQWEAAQVAKRGGQLPLNDGWKSKYEEPAAPDTSELPELPAGWAWTNLEALAWDSGYGTSEKCSYESTGLPVLRIPNVVKGQLSFENIKRAAPSAKINVSETVAPGDLLIIRTNGSKSLIGRAAVVFDAIQQPTHFASYLIRFRLLNEPMLHRWISATWNSFDNRKWIEEHAASSAGQHNISLGTLNNLPIPLPPLAEQAEIVAEVERRLTVLDALSQTLTAELTRAERLRQSLLHRAFTGRLVPQDATDEPAAALLARLREGAAVPAKAAKGKRRPESAVDQIKLSF